VEFRFLAQNSSIKYLFLLKVRQHCEINGLVCLNDHYEDLSIVIAPWAKARNRRGVVCDCLPSCEEVDIVVQHETRDNIFDPDVDPYSLIEISLANLPTERFKRNVVRGKLDLVGRNFNFFK
jgi:amiloride-sensitive sodium channel